MHETALRPGAVHQFQRHLIRRQSVNPLLPYLYRLPHGNPYVRIENVRVFHGFHGIFRKFQRRARLLRNRLTRFNQRLVGPIGFRGAGHETQSHFRAAYHETVAHIIAGVAQVNQLDAFQLAEMLLNRQEIRQDLRRVKLVRQTVERRHARVFCDFLHNGLTVAAVFNAVVHPPKDPRRIRDALLDAHLTSRRNVGGAHAQVIRRHFKRATRPRGRFLENQRDVLAVKVTVRDARLFFGFEVGGGVKKLLDFRRGKVQEL